MYNSVTELEMETDIVRKCIADYLHKIDRYRQQRDELQGRIDATRRKIAWHEKRIIRLSEQQKRIEEHFTEAIEIARESGIDLEHLTSLLTLLYEEE